MSPPLCSTSVGDQPVFRGAPFQGARSSYKPNDEGGPGYRQLIIFHGQLWVSSCPSGPPKEKQQGWAPQQRQRGKGSSHSRGGTTTASVGTRGTGENVMEKEQRFSAAGVSSTATARYPGGVGKQMCGGGGPGPRQRHEWGPEGNWGRGGGRRYWETVLR